MTDHVIIEFKGLRELNVEPEIFEIDRPRMYQVLAITDDFKVYNAADYRVFSWSSGINKVIFSGPCTIVLWNDGSKTIVRCTDEKFDKEKGLAMCIAKKALGNKGKYYDVFKKWIEEE